MKTNLFTPLLLIVCFITACSNEPAIKTLADIDDNNTHQQLKITSPTKKLSDNELKKAYYAYIKNASIKDKSRLAAINRLASMELNLGNNNSQTLKEEKEDQAYKATLERTVKLLNQSSKNFSKNKNNDQTLYQLAQTYDQLGQHNNSQEALKRLVKNHPKSKYYAESHFRIAESAFINREYITAETSYSETINSINNDHYYEKSLFKRGWARYKQELYNEAITDYITALNHHDFSNETDLNNHEKEKFDEYFRSIALSFIHSNGAEKIEDHFSGQKNKNTIYRIYSVMADTFSKQERYSDSVKTLKLYTSRNANSPTAPLAQLKILSIWKNGNFTQPLHDEFEIFYNNYQPKSLFWKKPSNSKNKKHTLAQLRIYLVDSISYYHHLYQKSSKKSDYLKANTWYKRYLDNFKAYAQKDSIYPQYAELLSSQGRKEDAIAYFELAAYADDLILDKKSAFATISLSDNLHSESIKNKTADQEKWLEKYIDYTSRYLQLYPNDKRSSNIISRAVELSFHHKRYNDTLKLAELTPKKSTIKTKLAINTIKAQAYFKLKQYPDAESSYNDLLLSKYALNSKQRKDITNSMALSIYRNAEQSSKNKTFDAAIMHFARISDIVPKNKLASSGLQEAVSLAINHKKWTAAVSHGEKYQQLYSKTKANKIISRQLSVAYLNSNQNNKAAKQLSIIAKNDDDKTVKKSALWQAALLHEKQGDLNNALLAYRDYANNYPSPYAQNIEAMYKLTELYKANKKLDKRYFWQTRIKNHDKKKSDHLKNDRTNHIASVTILDLANQKMALFTRTKLLHPLKRNLKIKKQAMQESIKLFGQAASYGLTNVTTQATYSIADIYRTFSVSLLESQRPKNLNSDELEQYEILLEDQAFPFEEKSIEFYETNLSRVKDNVYNKWIQASFDNLLQLFPARFARQGKFEVLFDE